MIAQQRGLEDYKRVLDEITRRVWHVLGDRCDEGLVQSSELTGLGLLREIGR